MIKDFKTAVVISEDHLSLIVKLLALYYLSPSFYFGHLEMVGFHLPLGFFRINLNRGVKDMKFRGVSRK